MSKYHQQNKNRGAGRTRSALWKPAVPIGGARPPPGRPSTAAGRPKGPPRSGKAVGAGSMPPAGHRTATEERWRPASARRWGERDTTAQPRTAAGGGGSPRPRGLRLLRQHGGGQQLEGAPPDCICPCAPAPFIGSPASSPPSFPRDGGGQRVCGQPAEPGAG